MKKTSIFLLAAFTFMNTYAYQNADADTVYPGPYALVAGGSKGIGYAISEALAKRKFNLILIARHSDSLVAAKNKLESAYNINVEILRLDLEHEKTADSIARWCKEKDI